MKHKLFTHYDNLRVARDAPDEVIKAAYRALSQKYHPDKNPQPDAEQVMAQINQSYSVLSDPYQRRKHDAWIASQEKNASPPPRRPKKAPEPRVKPEPVRPRKAHTDAGKAPRFTDVPPTPGGSVWRYRHLEFTPRLVTIGVSSLLLLAALVFTILHDRPVSMSLPSADEIAAAQRKPQDKVAVRVAAGGFYESKNPETRKWREWENKPVDVITASASPGKYANGPDGLPWPLGPKEYRHDSWKKTGDSVITVDNSRNTHAVHVKVNTGARVEEIAGELYIPAHRLIALENLPSGVYRLKYRDLETGSTMQSEPVLLEDVRTEPPFEYGVLEVSLYATPAENVGFHAIPDTQF